MKLTVVVQGFKGSSPVPAREAGAFLVRSVLIDGQEITTEKCILDCTPGGLLMFTLTGASPVGNDGFDPNNLETLWAVSDDELTGSPFEIEFREASR